MWHILGKVNDLLGERTGSLEILVSDLSTHTDLGSSLDSRFNLLGQNSRKIGFAGICAESHLEHDLGVRKVVVEDLGELGKVPSVPLLDSHGVCVELLVENIETGNALDDHGVDLIGRELELVAREGMRKTEAGRIHLGGDEVGNERGHVLADRAVYILGRRVGHELQREARDLGDGVGELGVGNSHCSRLATVQQSRNSAQERTRGLGLVLELLQQVGQHRADLAVGEGRGLVESCDGILELLEALELQCVDDGGDVLGELIALAKDLLVL